MQSPSSSVTLRPGEAQGLDHPKAKARLESTSPIPITYNIYVQEFRVETAAAQYMDQTYYFHRW